MLNMEQAAGFCIRLAGTIPVESPYGGIYPSRITF